MKGKLGFVLSGIRITILVVIIASLAGLIAFLANYIITDVYNRIPITFDITSNERDGRNATIQITNNGNAPLTHFAFIIKTPKTITNYTNLTDVQLDLRKPLSDVLEGHTPKLVEGGGAIILISTSIKGDKNFQYNNYTAYADYDQGSANLTRIDQLSDLRSSMWDEIGYQFSTFDVPIKIGIIVTIIVILSSILLLTIHKIYADLRKFIIYARRKLKGT